MQEKRKSHKEEREARLEQKKGVKEKTGTDTF